jgi:hypothetical protein
MEVHGDTRSDNRTSQQSPPQQSRNGPEGETYFIVVQIIGSGFQIRYALNNHGQAPNSTVLRFADPLYCPIGMLPRTRPILRSIFPPITIIPKRSAMFSEAALDAGVLEDVQNWHRRISPKVPSYWVYTKQIQKSQQDDREYRLIRLDNGLQAMLVHDAKADKAAASLDIAVGHLHDPVSTLSPFPVLGIAHTWHSNRPTCQGLPISASIYYSWCFYSRGKRVRI